MKQNLLLVIQWIITLSLSSCSIFPIQDKDDTPNSSGTYFPPNQVSEWETTLPEALGWDTVAFKALELYLDLTGTRAFILLKDGRIVFESYFGKDLFGQPFHSESQWYWASAGKTLTAATIGISQKKGFLSIEDPTSKYLGHGWTSITSEEEDQISIKHQLTMTSGLGYTSDPHCTLKDCLSFKAIPGTRWDYHNAPYTLLAKVIESATGQSFSAFFNTELAHPIGMKGFWQYIDYNHIFFSDARSMARFGLLMMNEGYWENHAVIGDSKYFQESINTSQDLNPSYGYLWWLNGKSSIKVPGIPFSFQRMLCPNAPLDMIAAMGKNGQLLNIVPSAGLVMVRMGENPEEGLVSIQYQNKIWEMVNDVIGR